MFDAPERSYEVENRNGACVMEVASLDPGAKMRTKEWGKYEELSAGMIEWKPRPICS